MWVSEYSWGWAPFHYGRWYTDPYYGPMWVPDYDWGPGWVTWRRSGDYYGWAPIGPGVSINVAYSNGYYVPNDRWTYVRDRDFGRRDINNYYVRQSNNVTIINNSTVINNTRVDRTENVTYNAGPDRTEVEKHVGKSIAPVAVKASSTPGQHITKNEVQIYSPQVQKNASSGSKPAPSKVADLKDVKPPQQRSGNTAPQKANKTTKQQQSQQQTVNRPSSNISKISRQNSSLHSSNISKISRQNSSLHSSNISKISRHKQQPAQQQHQQDQPAKQQPATAATSARSACKTAACTAATSARSTGKTAACTAATSARSAGKTAACTAATSRSTGKAAISRTAKSQIIYKGGKATKATKAT